MVCFLQEDQSRYNVPNLVVMVTDGESSNRDGAVFEAYNAKQEGIDIIALGKYYPQIDIRPE